ncbi:MAG: hypothetical protein ACE5FU_09360 [Nitrospinota bacterium]
MIALGGLGWINAKEYGCVNQSIRVRYDTKAISLKKESFLHPFENFGRLDAISKMTCYAIGLALKDADLFYPTQQKQEIGIISTNSSGCTQSDVNYFKDYLENGRTLSRGNLFIYTLPSSPLSEAAIHFGIEGPLFYWTNQERSLAELVDMAAEMICLDEACMMLAGTAEENGAVFGVLSEYSDNDHVLGDLEQAKSILTEQSRISFYYE